MHKLCQASSKQILDDFKPNLMIAIGGGGYVPARILRYASPFTIGIPRPDSFRSFLKQPDSRNIPIQAIGLSLYESLSTVSNPDEQVEAPGTRVTRTQWLDLSSLEMANLVGKNVLIVDEVDDTRTTLEYAVRELEKDVENTRQEMIAAGKGEQYQTKTRFSVFVLHVRGVSSKSIESETNEFYYIEQGESQKGPFTARHDG